MIEHLNDAEVLDDTPIGTLRVIDWFGVAAVAVMDKHDDERPVRVIHTLKRGENPLAAVYGKRTMEQPRVIAAYNAAVAARVTSENDRKADLRADFRRDLKRFLFKHDDGREALAARFTEPG